MSASMVTIRLAGGVWRYDPDEQLGPAGGFGVVFGGVGAEDQRVAIKRLKLEATSLSHREMAVASELRSRDLEHVIPILDSGRDAESDAYFVVMPRAEKSLQDELAVGRTWQSAEAARILLQIAEGLSEVADLVHRDLKPGNILLYEGGWRIADFGIARFVEDSTSVRTLKGCLSPEYAAPEQWELERATHATDIYALGCIGLAILTGSPPFNGTSTEDLREKHLQETPQIPAVIHPRLRSLLSIMLRKVPMSRPSLDRVKSLLTDVGTEPFPAEIASGFSELGEAGADVAARAAGEEARLQELETIRAGRERLAAAGLTILRSLRAELFTRICTHVPLSERRGSDVLRIHNVAKVVLAERSDPIHHTSQSQRSKWDFLAGATILVEQLQPRYARSASLWYVQRPGDSDFRWYEVSYETNPMLCQRRECEPFAIASVAEADEAHAPGMYPIQIAAGPYLVDDENAQEFYDRWASVLARAVSGKLHVCR